MLKLKMRNAGKWMLLLLSGCEGGLNGPLPPWHDVYGNVCAERSAGPSPGCNFYQSGRKIQVEQDPYFDDDTDVFHYSYVTYLDSYGVQQSFLGWVWLSPNGIIYTDSGRALNSEDEVSGRDIVQTAAEQEEQTIQLAGADFSSRYALQEVVGVDVARTLNAWATLTRDRKVRVRTEADLADFSKRLFGVELTRAASGLQAFARNDVAQMRELSSQVASHWSTSPETAEQILKNWQRHIR